MVGSLWFTSVRSVVKGRSPRETCPVNSLETHIRLLWGCRVIFLELSNPKGKAGRLLGKFAALQELCMRHGAGRAGLATCPQWLLWLRVPGSCPCQPLGARQPPANPPCDPSLSSLTVTLNCKNTFCKMCDFLRSWCPFNMQDLRGGGEKKSPLFEN